MTTAIEYGTEEGLKFLRYLGINLTTEEQRKFRDGFDEHHRREFEFVKKHGTPDLYGVAFVDVVGDVYSAALLDHKIGEVNSRTFMPSMERLGDFWRRLKTRLDEEKSKGRPGIPLEEICSS